LVEEVGGVPSQFNGGSSVSILSFWNKRNDGGEKKKKTSRGELRRPARFRCLT